VALEDLVGFFVNTLVMRTDLTGDPTFAELVDRAAARGWDALANQDVPFERLVEELAPVRSLGRHPLFQVMLTMQNMSEAAVDLPGLQAGGASAMRPDVLTGGLPAKFDLEFSVAETLDADGRPAGLHGDVVASADLFTRATADKLVERLNRLLATVAADPGVRLSAIDVLLADEREQVLRYWNDTTAEARSGTIVELFEEQVARTPDAVAVSGSGTLLTYSELDARANQLARHLIGLGIGPEAGVAVCLARDVQAVVTLLGVLKAGAAYLPVDRD
jgi:non-ribosomal peptide synthetase component F